MSPRRGSKPRLSDRLVVGRNVTLTLTSQFSLQRRVSRPEKGGSAPWLGGQGQSRVDSSEIVKWVCRWSWALARDSAELVIVRESRGDSVGVVSQL
jgi:hypothetical protein